MAPNDEAGHPFKPGSVLQLLQLTAEDSAPAGDKGEQEGRGGEIGRGFQSGRAGIGKGRLERRWWPFQREWTSRPAQRVVYLKL